MTLLNDFSVLPESVAGLLAQRAQIDAKLDAIQKVLANGHGDAPATPAQPEVYDPATTFVVKGAPAVRKASAKMLAKVATVKRRKRKTFALTGEDSIVTFVASTAGDTTNQDIERHWKAEGRGGAAANAIGKLVKAGRLKRTPLADRRGSRYELA